MAYGKFITVIKKVDMFKNHLRLIVGNVEDENDKHVLLDPTEAQELVNKIYDVAGLHRKYLSSDYGDKLWERTIAYDPKGKAIR